MSQSKHINLYIQGGNNQILPNAETGIQNVYGIQTIASYKKNHLCYVAIAVLITMSLCLCVYCCLAHNALEKMDLRFEHMQIAFQKYQETHP